MKHKSTFGLRVVPPSETMGAGPRRGMADMADILGDVNEGGES